MLYLLIDPSTMPTNHAEGTVFYVGSWSDTTSDSGGVRAMLDLALPEALPKNAPAGVAERLAALWEVGVAPLVRVLSFGGPEQVGELDGPRLAWLWASALRPRPLNEPPDPARPASRSGLEERQVTRYGPQSGKWHASRRTVGMREWAVEDYVTVRDPRPVVLPREVPTLVAGLDLKRDAWPELAMVGLEMVGPPRRRWWGVSSYYHADYLWHWVEALREDPLLVLVVRHRPAGELCPAGLVVGVWWGQVYRDDDAGVLRVDPEPVSAEVTAMRRRLLRGVLWEDDQTPFSFASQAQDLVARPRPLISR